MKAIAAVLFSLFLAFSPLATDYAQAQTPVAPAPAPGISTGWEAVRTMNVRAAPTSKSPIVGEVKKKTKLNVLGWAVGEMVIGKNEMWAKIGEGQYVYSNGLTKPKPQQPPAPIKTRRGRWIDVNLSEQVITAYHGDKPIYWAVTSSGAPGWETPEGTFDIRRRKFVTTMDSTNLNEDDTAKLRADADQYRVTDVYFTQYFTDSGNAIHYNYWKWDSPFGVPTSHGCLGLPYADAYFFWVYAGLGTVMVIHY